ncbi:MAG: hypothetical protein QM783_00610 [Phycisphaerales bacterium]
MIIEDPSMVISRRASRLRAWRAATSHAGRAAWVPAAASVCSGGLLLLAALSGLLIAAAMVLTSSRPLWWNGSAMGRGEVRRSLAQRVDNNTWSVLTEIRPMRATGEGQSGSTSEPWSVSLSAESANAWLNETLPRWLAVQESGLSVPAGAEMQAGFEPGEIHIGLRVPDANDDRFVSLTVTPQLDDKGLWLPASASVGRLSLPVTAVLPSRAGFNDVLRGTVPALPGGVFKLPDGRRVRLLRFEAVQDHLVLTMRTEAGR